MRRPVQSGNSEKPRLSKIGDPLLRKVLYLPTLVAWQHNPALKAFRQRLQARCVGRIRSAATILRIRRPDAAIGRTCDSNRHTGFRRKNSGVDSKIRGNMNSPRHRPNRGGLLRESALHGLRYLSSFRDRYC